MIAYDNFRDCLDVDEYFKCHFDDQTPARSPYNSSVRRSEIEYVSTVKMSYACEPPSKKWLDEVTVGLQMLECKGRSAFVSKKFC